MKTNKKTKLAVLLAIVVALSIGVIACSNKSEPKEETKPVAKTETTEVANKQPVKETGERSWNVYQFKLLKPILKDFPLAIELPVSDENLKEELTKGITYDKKIFTSLTVNDEKIKYDTIGKYSALYTITIDTKEYEKYRKKDSTIPDLYLKGEKTIIIQYNIVVMVKEGIDVSIITVDNDEEKEADTTAKADKKEPADKTAAATDTKKKTTEKAVAAAAAANPKTETSSKTEKTEDTAAPATTDTAKEPAAETNTNTTTTEKPAENTAPTPETKPEAQKPSQPAKNTHTHSWQPHYVEKLISEAYDEPIYETVPVYEMHAVNSSGVDLDALYAQTGNGMSWADWKEVMYTQGIDAYNYVTQEVQVGTEERITGYNHHQAVYENVLEYEYCADNSCGVRK